MMTTEDSATDPEQAPTGTEPGQPLQYAAGRFPKWIALFVLSLVAWFATIAGVQRHQMDRPEKWALTATTLSVVFGGIGVFAYVFLRGLFMGQIPEVVTVAVALIIWAGGLPVIMNPGNSIAVGYTDYLDANLYFSSWLACLSAVWIAGDLAKELYGVDVVGMASPKVKSRRGKWYALIATSLIVMGSSVRVFLAFPCSSQAMAKSPICRQTEFAISAGVIGTLFAMVATLCMAKGNFSQLLDWCSSIVMAIIWCFGLGFITFGSGPGHNIGNLYFATWGSFILSILLVGESYREHMGMRERAEHGMTYDEEEMNSSNDPNGSGPGAHPVQVRSQ